MFLKKNIKSIFRTSLPDLSDSELLYRNKIQLALNLVTNMDFYAAESYLQQLINQYPNDITIAQHLFHIRKLNAKSPDFSLSAKKIISLYLQDEVNFKKALWVYRDYKNYNFRYLDLDDNTEIKLLMAFAKIREVNEADRMMMRLISKNCHDPLMLVAAEFLVKVFIFIKKEDKVRFYERYLEIGGL